MKTSVASLLGAAGIIACASCASAFIVPSATARASPAARAAARQAGGSAPNSGRRTVRLSAEKKEEEDQEPMDLDLEQMFEVFDAADKEVSDEAVGKKGDKKAADAAKDPAEAMGDMLSSFFGGGKK